MKRLLYLLSSLLLLALSIFPALPASAAPANLIANPGAETSTNGTTPDNWFTGKWGNNKSTFTYTAANWAHSGNHALKAAIGTYTDGDAKWYFNPVAVTAGTKYNFSEWYHSSTPTNIVVQFDNGTSYSYADLGVQPTVTPWTQVNTSFTVPAGMTHATVFHIINSVGWVITDDYSLTQQSDLTTAITSPASGTNVSGTSVALTASANSNAGVAGVQFKVDGQNIGGEVTTAPYQTAWNSTGVSNGAHTISVVARDNDGVTASASSTVTVSNALADGVNMITNPGAETTASGSTTAPAFWQSNSWGNNKATFTYTGSNWAHNSSHALKVSVGSYTDGDAKWYFAPQPVDASRLYTFSDYYTSSIESYAVADFGMSDGTDQYVTLGTLKPSSSWAKFEEQFSVPAGAKTITVFHLIHGVGWLITDDYALSSYTPVGFNRALVSLTFDDAWASVYTNALPVLQKYGYHSTQYLLSGNTADPEYMTANMMLAMKNAGEEIASHTVDHQDLVTLSVTQQQQELNNSKTSLQTWTGATVTDFASPYGSADQNVVTQIKKYYSSHRGVVTGFNSKNYFNAYDIKVQDVTSSTTAAQVQAWVAQAQATKTWLVLVYHQVSDSPSAGDYNTPPAQLDAHLTAIHDSGIAVLTVSQALAELKPQL